MATFLFANNATTTIAASISSSATVVAVASGTGSLFPTPSAGQQFAFTFNDAATGLLNEICYCTSRTGDALTIVRGQEGTTAQNWNAGDLGSSFVTAGVMTGFVQQATIQPARIVTASGVFAMSRSDEGGGIGLNRTVAPAISSTTLPSNALVGDIYWIEDLAGNFSAFPCTVNAPGGMTIAGLASAVLNVNRQCSQFRFYGSNLWSWDT